MPLAEIVSIAVIALGLSADCFAVSLSAGASAPIFKYRSLFRLAFFFGLFQAVMPVLGWLAGESIVDVIAGYDHWAAFGLLVLVGGHMLWESFQAKAEKKVDVTRGAALATLSIATSIDALAVGLSFAFLKIDIAAASIIIGVVAFAVSGVGFWMGRQTGRMLGRWAELAGGIILIGIGFRVLLSHLLG